MRRLAQQLSSGVSLFLLCFAFTTLGPQQAKAQLTSAPRIAVNLFNVDDSGTASVNGRQVASAGFNQVASADATPHLTLGQNSLLFQFFNNASGWTFGYRVTAETRTVLEEICGTVNRTGCGGTQTGLVRSRSLDLTYYSVPGIGIPILRQVGDTCWAYTATMMLSWRDRRVYIPREIIRRAGAEYEDLLVRGKPLPFETAPRFFSQIGLRAEAPQNYSLAGWMQLLRTHGPVWITTVISPRAVSAHARVLYAIAGDGSGDRTYLFMIDPQIGQTIIESLNGFNQSFERIARQDLGPGGNLNPQVFHF